MKNLIYLLLILCYGSVQAQKQYTAANAAELKSIVGSLKAGDVVTLKEGVWNDMEIVVDNNGASGRPITIRAQTPGKTIVTGNSSFKLGGAYIVLQDLVFKNIVPAYRHDDAIVAFRTDAKEGKNDILKSCKFIQDENLQIQNDRAHGFFWVDVYGSNNTIDGCTFQGKKNWLPIIDIKTKNGQQGHHIIQNNLFSDTQPQPGISLESIRVGMAEGFPSNTTIRNNLFVRCNGDSEIISTKSSNNYILNNYFVRCYASVSLRGGNGIIVKGNYFYYTLGGLRVNGSDHEITGNYFYRIQENPIALMMGSRDKDCGYQPVSNVKIDSNYFVSNARFVVLQHYNNKCNEVPKDIELKNNFLLGKDGQEMKLGEGDVMKQADNSPTAMLAKKSAPAAVNRLKAAPAGSDKSAAELEIQVDQGGAQAQDAAGLRSNCDFYTKSVLNNLNSKLTGINIKAIPDKAGTEDRQLSARSSAAGSAAARGNVFDKIGTGF